MKLKVSREAVEWAFREGGELYFKDKERARKICEMRIDGATYREIGETCGIHFSTVRELLWRIMKLWTKEIDGGDPFDEFEDEEKRQRRGRPSSVDDPEYNLIWKVDRRSNKRNITLATISMCIKDDMNQSLEELAERVAECKARPFGESLAVLRELSENGKLGYYDNVTMVFRKWEPGRKACS